MQNDRVLSNHECTLLAHQCKFGEKIAWVSRSQFLMNRILHQIQMYTDRLAQIAKFMGPTWRPPGSCRPQMGPMLAPWTLLSGWIYLKTHYVGKALRRLSAWDPGCGGPSTPIRVGHPWAAARCAALVQRFSQWPVKKYFFSNRCKSQNKHQNWILQLETNKSSGRTTEFHRV